MATSTGSVSASRRHGVTDPEAERVQTNILCALPVWKRLAQVDQICELTAARTKMLRTSSPGSGRSPASRVVGSAGSRTRRSQRAGWLAAASLACLLLAPSSPAGKPSDSVALTSSESYVLDRGTVSAAPLPDLASTHTVGGTGRGRLSPTHQLDQAIRLSGETVIAEDHDQIRHSFLRGDALGQRRAPTGTSWFVPVGDPSLARSLVLAGSPPAQTVRPVVRAHEPLGLKEPKRQPAR